MNESDFIYSLNLDQRRAYQQIKRENQNKLIQDVVWVAEMAKQTLYQNGGDEEASGAGTVISEIERNFVLK